MEKYNKDIKELDKFLEENPHMNKFQEEIEIILNNCIPKDRIETLSIMLSCKLNEFAEQLYKIRDINEKIIR